MKPRGRFWLAAALALALGMQCIPAGNPRGPVVQGASLAAPERVRDILQRSCYECHSAGAYRSWYARVAPLSWWAAAEVRHAQAGLDFSNWAGYPAGQQAYLLRNAVDRIRVGNMPPPAYASMHRRVRLTPTDLSILADYAESLAPPPALPRGTIVLSYCRDDGELGEPYERRILASRERGLYRLWDPEFGGLVYAGSVDEALTACARLLSAGPSMRLATWERKYRAGWRRELERLP